MKSLNHYERNLSCAFNKMTDLGSAPAGGEMDGGRRHRASRKGRRGTRKTRKSTRKQSKWMQHVMATKRANKGKDLTEVLKMASETYKKTGGGASSAPPGVASGAGELTGGRKTRKAKKSRKH